MDLVTFKIPNWEKFNPRSDRGNFSWFRLENSFFIDQEIFPLTSDAKLLFIFLCCEASRHNSETVTLNVNYVAALLKRDAKKIVNDFSLLRSSGLVELLKDSSRVSDENALTAYETEQNRTEQNETNTVSTELEKKSPANGAVEGLRGNNPVERFLEPVKHTVQNAWLDAYPDAEWIKQEILTAIAWIEANPKKRPKSVARFMGAWLSRGWEKRRKSIPSSLPLSFPSLIGKNEMPEPADASPCDLCSDGRYSLRHKMDDIQTKTFRCTCAKGKRVSSLIPFFDEQKFPDYVEGV